MTRWCPNSDCDRYRQSVPGTPNYCTACGKRMSGIRPPTPVVLPETPPPLPVLPTAEVKELYVPCRLPEMSDDQWAHYQTRVQYNADVHEGRARADLKEGSYLYHATGPDNLEAIAEAGLCPRDPSWRKYKKTDRVPRYDASKDGYLSMATTESGAGAIGRFVLLRMQVGEDIGDWDWRQVGGSTEVRSTKPIPPEKLEWREKKGGWKALTT